jgi:hypothetical protein
MEMLAEAGAVREAEVAVEQAIAITQAQGAKSLELPALLAFLPVTKSPLFSSHHSTPAWFLALA